MQHDPLMNYDAVDDEESLSTSFLDTDEFIKYRELCEKFAKKAQTAICTRDLHTHLDSRSRMEWTADALESSKVMIELRSPILPSRWVYFKHVDKVAKETDARRARGDNNYLFANRREEKERNALLPYGVWEGSRDT